MLTVVEDDNKKFNLLSSLNTRPPALINRFLESVLLL
jgi:hypothetical protein